MTFILVKVIILSCDEYNSFIGTLSRETKEMRKYKISCLDKIQTRWHSEWYNWCIPINTSLKLTPVLL